MHTLVGYTVFLISIIALYLWAAKTTYGRGEKRDLYQYVEKKPSGRIDILARVIIIALIFTGMLTAMTYFVGSTDLEVKDNAESMRFLFGVFSYIVCLFGFEQINTRSATLQIAAMVIPLPVVAAWLLYPHWITLDIMAYLTAWALLIQLGRFTLKNALVFAAAIILYDVTAVFGSGMMIDLADKVTQSPSPSMGIQPLMPQVFLIPFSWSWAQSGHDCGLIGLGDVVAPGILIMVAMREAKRFKIPTLGSAALGGYAFGYVIGLIVMFITGAPQPFTLYLFPPVIAAIIVVAKREGVWTELLNPLKEEEADCAEINETAQEQ